MIAELSVGDTMTLTVWRKDPKPRSFDVTVTLKDVIEVY